MLSVDYFILERLVEEFRPQISGARIGKIHQPADGSLILRLWNGRENLRLLIQTGSAARIHLTRQTFPNPFRPPRFCQLLRSRLRRLEAIELPGFDRIVELVFSGTDQRYRLICELIGSRSNLYLVDEAGRLLDAMHKPHPMAERILQRGQPYQALPRSHRRSLADPAVAPPDAAMPAAAFEQWLLREIEPMAKGQASALKIAVELGRDNLSVLNEFRRAWIMRQASPSLAEIDGKTRLIAYLPEGVEPLGRADGSLSDFLDSSFAQTGDTQVEIGDRARFRRIISGQMSRLRKRLQHISNEQEKTATYSERRHLGELLLANLHLVTRGMDAIDVTDWGKEPSAQVRIPLQQELSPQENAERLFKRYKKEKRGVDHIERRQQETLEEIEWLEGLELALDEATGAGEVDEVGMELRTAGMIPVPKGEPAHRHKNGEAPRLNRTESPNGLRIFWGRNNRSNDHLSSRMTDRDDLWFHAHNMPGCHLVLKRDGRSTDFPTEDIDYAARIAAGYSRGKGSAKVEVIVTEGRHVNRPKGCRPGLVTLGPYRTVLVAPLRKEPEE